MGNTINDHVIEQKLINGQMLDVVVVGKEFEADMDSDPRIASTYIDDYLPVPSGCRRRPRDVLQFVNSRFGVDSSLTNDPELADIAPRGMLAPWYIPVTDYNEWAESNDFTVKQIVDFARYGIKYPEYLAVRRADPSVRAPLTIAAYLDGWKVLGLKPSAEEIEKFTLRTMFFWDNTPSSGDGEKNAATISRASRLSTNLTQLISIHTHEHWFSDLNRDLFTLTAAQTSYIIRNSSSGLDNEAWNPASLKVKRARTLLEAADGRISFDTMGRMMSCLMSIQDELREGINMDAVERSKRSRSRHDLDVSIVSLIQNDEQGQALCDVADELNGNYVLTMPIEEVIEMIHSGTPADWIIASALEPFNGKR